MIYLMQYTVGASRTRVSHAAAMTGVINGSRQSNPTGAKLTATQFRMLQRIPDEGLSLSALRRQGHSTDVRAQIRALRTLIPLHLVVETQGEGDDVRFEITAAGRRLIKPGAR